MGWFSKVSDSRSELNNCNSSPWYFSVGPFHPSWGSTHLSMYLCLLVPLPRPSHHTINWLLQLKRGVSQASLKSQRLTGLPIQSLSYCHKWVLQATKFMHPLDYTRMCLKLPHIFWLALASRAHKGSPECAFSGALSARWGNALGSADWPDF